MNAVTLHRSPTDEAAYPRKSSATPVASGVARGTTVTRAGALTSPSRPPSPTTIPPETVSLRPIKEFVRNLRPDHPLRLVLVGEPDEMDRSEYYVKLTIWLRLLPLESGANGY